MPKAIKCFITSIREEIYHDDVESLVAVGTQGELGIMPGHAPLLTELVPGPIQLRRPGGEELIFYISGGFLEVRPDSIHVLADEAVREEGLDSKAAEEAKRQAAEALAGREKLADYEMALARAKLAEATAQLRTLRRIRDRLKR